MDKEKNIRAKIEAVLFVHGEPITFKKLGSLLGVTEKKVKEEVDIMKSSFDSEDRGLDLLVTGEKVQLVTSPFVSDISKKLVKEELDSKLTPASLETLSIIAYLGPCTRALIEYIRGVNSSFILRNLMIRGLIERTSDPATTGGYVYQVSFDFLKHMGVTNPTDLPEYAKYQELAKVFLRQENESETKN